MTVTQYIQKERYSNIELLRIISMLLIIMGHLYGQSGAFDNLALDTKLIISFMGSGSRIAVNLFLMIGVWFMVDSNFASTRIVKLYGELSFYSVIITLIMIFVYMCTGGEVPIKSAVKGFVPLFGKALWFASAYIFLVAISPYLKLIFRLNHKSIGKLIVLLFIMICVFSTFSNNDQTGYVADSLYFIFIYIFIGFHKNELNKIKKEQAYLIGVIGLVIYIILILFENFKYICGNNQITAIMHKLGNQYLGDIKTIPNIACAFCIFIFFLNLNLGKNKYINYIAKSTFAIYIIHQVPIFSCFLWKNVFRCDSWPQSNLIIVYYIVTTVLIYGFGMFTEILRTKYAEGLWMESRSCNKICKWLNQFYYDINMLE